MPFKKVSRYWIAQLGGWGSFALLHTLIAYSFKLINEHEDALHFFGRLSIFVVLGLIMTHFMRFVIIRFNILQQNFEKQILQFLLLTFFFSFITSFIDITLLKYYGLLNSDEARAIPNKPMFVVLSGATNSFAYLFIWNLIYFTYHYVEKSRKQQLDTLHLEALVKELELKTVEAQLKTIKAHINPHFIFNALNGIRALIDADPSRARRAVTELSNILRSSLKAEKGETVAFGEELKIVKDYLALESMRFEDRLQVTYAIEEETLHLQVPPMMLQTLVENAIKHGISHQVHGGLVEIHSYIKSGSHFMCVQNTGALTRFKNREGFGLISTEERLQLLYHGKAHFSIKQSSENVVQASISIPLPVTQLTYSS